MYESYARGQPLTVKVLQRMVVFACELHQVASPRYSGGPEEETGLPQALLRFRWVRWLAVHLARAPK